MIVAEFASVLFRWRPSQRAELGDVAVCLLQCEAALDSHDRAAAAARTDGREDGADVMPADRTVRGKRQQVAGEHVHPPQPVPPLGPHGSFAVVGDGVGDLLGPHQTIQRVSARSQNPTPRTIRL